MGEKTLLNKFIRTSLFRDRPLIRGLGSPDEWGTTKQVCGDELVVYLFFFFSHIYIYIYR